MFEQNYSILEKMVAEKGVIIPVSPLRSSIKSPCGRRARRGMTGKRPPCSPSPP